MAKNRNSFEDKIKRRYTGYEPQPPGNIWPQIVKKINKINRRKFLLILLLLMIISAATGFYISGLNTADNASVIKFSVIENHEHKPSLQTHENNTLIIQPPSQVNKKTPLIKTETPATPLREASPKPDKLLINKENHNPVSLVSLAKHSNSASLLDVKSPSIYPIPEKKNVSPLTIDPPRHIIDIFITSGLNYGNNLITNEHTMHLSEVNLPYFGVGIKYGRPINSHYTWFSGFSIESQHHKYNLPSALPDRPKTIPISFPQSTTFTEYKQFSTLNLSFWGELQRKLPRNFYLKTGAGLYHSRVIRTVTIDNESNLTFDTFDKINSWTMVGAGYSLNLHNFEVYFEAGGQYFFPAIWPQGLYEVPVRIHVNSGYRFIF